MTGTAPAGATSAPITDAPAADAAMPLNSQLGSARVALNCNFPILGQQTLIAEFEGTFATLLGAGQTFYLNDGRGGLELPAQLVSLLRGLGTTSFDANITKLNLNATNATPSSVNALATPISLTNQALPASGGAVIPIIPPGGSLKVGPFVAGPSGTVYLGLGEAGGSVTRRNGIASILGTLNVSCAAPSSAVILAGINISGTNSAVSAPTTGGAYTYPTAPLDHQVGSAKLPLSCTIPGLGERDIPLTLTGDAGTVYGTGEQFYLANATGALDLSPALTSDIVALYPGSVSTQVTVTRFNIDSSGASPATVNAANTPIVLGSQPLAGGTGLQLRVPSTGYLNVGPFTAGAAGTMRLELGEAAATITLRSASQSMVGTTTVTCAKRSPAVIIVPLTAVKVPVARPSFSIIGPSGSVQGGSIVTFTGSNLGNAREVFFGTTPAPWLAPFNSGLLFVQTPAHAAGTVPVTVRTLGGTTSSGTFTFK